MHWTQTPEGRDKMAGAMKRWWAKRKKEPAVPTPAESQRTGAKPMHWTQTPEGRRRMAAMQIRRLKGKNGRAHLAAMRKGRERVEREKRQLRKKLATTAVDLATETLPIVAARNGHTKMSGRAMVLELARVGAASRRNELIRELERLTIFLNHTKS